MDEMLVAWLRRARLLAATTRLGPAGGPAAATSLQPRCTNVLPADAAEARCYMMEYGIRGDANCGTQPLVHQFAYYSRSDELHADLADECRSPGSSKLWFSINAAQLGFDGDRPMWDLRTGPSTTGRTRRNQSGLLDDRPARGRMGAVPRPTTRRPPVAPDDGTPGWQVISVSSHGTDDDWKLPDAEHRCRRAIRHATQPEQELVAVCQGPERPTHDLIGLDTHGQNAERRFGRSVVVVQHRRAAAGHDVHPRGMERNRRRHGLDRRDGSDERGGRRAVRGAAPGGLRPDDGTRFLNSRPRRPRFGRAAGVAVPCPSSSQRLNLARVRFPPPPFPNEIRPRFARA